MNVSLTPSLEQFVRDCSETGDYNNASEVVREALRLLKQQKDIYETKMERLRAAIQEGADAYEQGEYITLKNEKEINAFFDSLK